MHAKRSPTVTLLPMLVLRASPLMLCLATWITTLSWMLVLEPTSMLFTSPRSTAPYQIEELGPIFTLPSTFALGATKTSAALTGITMFFREGRARAA